MTAMRSSGRPMLVTTAVAAVLLAAGILASLSLGELSLSPGEVLGALVGQGDSFTQLTVIDFRGPRVAAAVLVGAALALSGAALQSVARNPLASPDVLGINAGASVGAVSVVILAGSAGGVSGMAAALGLPLAALLGAAVSGTVLYLLAVRGRRLEPLRLVIVGVALSAAGASLVSWLLTLGDVAQVGPAVAWLSGSLHASTWPRVAGIGVALVLLTPLVLSRARALDVLVLGDDAAAALGVPVDRTRAVLVLLATALAGAATAVGGAIGFLALVAPQVARRSSGTVRPPLVASALVGAAVLVWADLLARMGLSWLGLGPIELPVGVFTAALGAPYLLYLVAGRGTATAEVNR